MTSRYARLTAVAIAITACGVPLRAQQREVDGANAVLPWAFAIVSNPSRSTSVSIHGPMGLKVSVFLERHKVPSIACQLRSLTSLPMV